MSAFTYFISYIVDHASLIETIIESPEINTKLRWTKIIFRFFSRDEPSHTYVCVCEVRGSACKAECGGPWFSSRWARGEEHVGRGRCRLGFLPSEGQPEGPNYQSSSWSVKRRVYVCAREGVHGREGGGGWASLARTGYWTLRNPPAKRAWWSQPDGIEGGRKGGERRGSWTGLGEWWSRGGSGGCGVSGEVGVTSNTSPPCSHFMVSLSFWSLSVWLTAPPPPLPFPPHV